MSEKSQNTVAVDDRLLTVFEGNLRRIFAMRITRSTFRELQNVILACADQNQEKANFLFETLLTGQIKHPALDAAHRRTLEGLIKDFTIPARLAKEVYERGEFINVITSDVLSQKEEYAFLNRMRRIDGEEFVFMSDPQNTVHLVQHFVGRLYELASQPKGKEELLKYKKELLVMAERLKQLTV